MNKVNFSPFPNLTTERLALRQLTSADEDEIFKLRSDELVNEFLDRPKANSLEDAQNFINKINTGINCNESMFWAIVFKDTPKLIGTICLWNISEDDFQAEVGYELLPDFQGKGIMREALVSVVKFGFESLKLKTIVAYSRFDNIRSKKLLEKTGFEIDTTIANDEENMVVYSLNNPVNE